MDKSQLIETIKKAVSTNLNMYFVTRILKEGVKNNAKVLEKFDFKVYQIEITDEIRTYLFDLSMKQFEKIEKNNELDFVDYDVISDDTEHLFTYSMLNKVGSFSDVVYNQLNNSPQKITNLNQILSSESLWAYCVGFQIDSENTFYTFRKISAGKVGIDEKDDNQKKGISNTIRTFFDTNTNTLSLLKGETVYLDKNIDCIFYGEVFYILRKFYFEQILGLQEEYKKRAEEIAVTLKKHVCFGEVSLLSNKIQKSPSFHKKLMKLEKLGSLNNLNERTLKKLEKLGKSKKAPINIKDGKIIFETDQDIDNTIKLLCDYYKTGDYSGNSYGTYAGKIQKTEEV
ncbi:Kiwa anti-phage protein KwaB-like domain-containing protein [Flavobacterium piscisymbiosum]|uniref:DUF4868 domain-containing protein n=1 Tax=Flavobacterium piscisymbiosum TaxID=2893753 RepID=A0ABS8MDP6_9FLAO|nr:Kiwa anti-phage protein KwaB-like domain-containing protein [Flavobacterium sp. F-30]MCC9063643.1 DUF4868 domain-containing protein [Flavobacterium sp. F-30]